MSLITNLYQNRTFSVISTALFCFVILFVLQSCGGGGGSSAPGDQDASGLFKNGTASLNAGAVTPSDLRAFVYDGRIIMFSISSHILFDGQITSISSNDFTATVDLYETGVMTQADIPVTGKVTSQSSITGTLGGTDVGSGSFSLTFDLAFSTTSSITKLDKMLDFTGNLLSTSSFNTDTNSTKDSITVSNSGFASTAILDQALTISCNLGGNASVPDPNINIYDMNQDLPSSNPFNSSCDIPLDPVDKFTGFLSLLSEPSSEGDLLYAVTNGTYSVFGIVSQP